jgi:hypothetical protein
MSFWFAFPLWLKKLVVSSSFYKLYVFLLFRTVFQLICTFTNLTICLLLFRFLCSVSPLNINAFSGEQLEKKPHSVGSFSTLIIVSFDGTLFNLMQSCWQYWSL